jgi:hypothetical protein
VSAGDRVVTTGFARLKDGSRVSVGTPAEVISDASDAKPAADAKPGAARENRGGNLRAACAADVQKLCPSAERSQLRTCLQTNAAQLSEVCKTAIAQTKADARSKADTGSTQ